LSLSKFTTIVHLKFAQPQVSPPNNCFVDKTIFLNLNSFSRWLFPHWGYFSCRRYSK